MTDTPIDRAARRMALIESGTDCFDQLDEAMQERLRESVRAVLEAVREPSDAMRSTAKDDDIWWYEYAVCGGLRGNPDGTWQQMIDAALSE